MNRKKLLLYLISKSGVIQGKTKIQKLVFLLQKEKNIPLSYTFYPYQQGPLSFELIEDINSLISNGFIIEGITQTAYAPRHDYSLSKIGQKYVERVVEKEVNFRDKAKINTIIKKWNYSSLDKLLNYVHRKYPEMRAWFK